MKKIGVLIGTQEEAQKKLASELISFLINKNRAIFCLPQTTEWLNLPELKSVPTEAELFQSVDLVITIGGDGTILSAARRIASYGVPICGLNMGRLGFLNELNLDRWKEDLGEILEGHFWIEERSILQAELIRQEEIVDQWIFVNDVVLSRIGYPHLITVDIFLDGVPTISYPGDGVIIATPTGSTAYSLSAGGPVLSPDMSAILITPICAHDFYSRPWVLSGKTVIELTADERSVDYGIAVDGKDLVPCQYQDRIRIFESAFKMKLLRLNGSSHYRNLRTRFHRQEQL